MPPGHGSHEEKSHVEHYLTDDESCGNQVPVRHFVPQIDKIAPMIEKPGNREAPNKLDVTFHKCGEYPILLHQSCQSFLEESPARQHYQGTEFDRPPLPSTAQ